jgi:hypothetical protein
MIDLSAAIWRKARSSAHNGGCVEVAGNLPGVTAVRDSKLPGAGALVVSRAAFAAFIADVRRGRYDVRSSNPRP